MRLLFLMNTMDSVMSAFPQLSDSQIDDILYYTDVGDPKTVLAPGAVVPNR